MNCLKVSNSMMSLWFQPNSAEMYFVPLYNLEFLGYECYKQLTLTFCNPLVPKAHNSECQNLPFPLQIKPVKVI